MEASGLFFTLLSNRLFKFLVVGLLNTFVGYSLYILSLWAGLHYAAALAVATVLGTLFNFKSIGRLVFSDGDHSKLPRFLLVYSMVYLVNVIGVGLLAQIGIAEWLGGLLLLLPLALLSYSLNSRFVFKL